MAADENLALLDADRSKSLSTQVGPHICLFKTHVDIFDHWDASVADKLRQLADKHGETALPLCFEADKVFQSVASTR